MRVRVGLIAGVGVLCLAASAYAHHSFVVEYDVSSPVRLEGVVMKFEWANPHASLHVDVVEASGLRTPWTFEMASPNVLERNGWTRRTLKVGDRVTLEGYGGVAVATRGMVTAIVMADGRALRVGEGPVTSDGARPGSRQ